MGYIILELEQQGGLAALNSIKFGTGVKTKDVTIFARQFSTMINAGLSLTKCLSILGAQTESAALRDDHRAGRQGRRSRPVALRLAGEAPQGLPADLRQHGPRRRDRRCARRGPAAASPTTSRREQALKAQDQVGDDLPDRDGRPRARHPGRDDDLRRADVREDVRGHGRRAAVHDAAARRHLELRREHRRHRRRRGRRRRRHLRCSSWWTQRPGQADLGRRQAAHAGLRPADAQDRAREVHAHVRHAVSAGVPILSALDIVGDTAGNEVVAQAVKKTRSAIKEGETIAKPLSESHGLPVDARADDRGRRGDGRARRDAEQDRRLLRRGGRRPRSTASRR